MNDDLGLLLTHLFVYSRMYELISMHTGIADSLSVNPTSEDLLFAESLNLIQIPENRKKQTYIFYHLS